MIGDNFVTDMVGEFLQANDENKPYMREWYDVKVLCSNSLSINRSVTARRLHNDLANGIVEQPLLPKAINFVIDSNIIKSLHHPEMGLCRNLWPNHQEPTCWSALHDPGTQGQLASSLKKK